MNVAIAYKRKQYFTAKLVMFCFKKKYNKYSETTL